MGRERTWKSDNEENMRVESNLRREIELSEDVPFTNAIR